ncbi:DsrE/DsrF/DrsH-like family protein [Paenibacillus validus]|uniref:DsrE/DsrF/DrsH-like family protein n=1 Tax=Paenibacillus chartarius TaxID=747481 RepID=A0ABV6DLP8_9BACL|nr:MULTISPECIES: DsrE/DsrF/DrsH-like family protein [Paenibacillaceae]ALS28909.1 DsrEFH-like protein [Paenibacillus sp. 32O-W]MBN2982273.1 DsrE/DsrF/DrsH-like family protein [Cohnella algarum]MED4600064.1 DsrE/DsrF/DrsH-like family protein [Paenibacillus validus]MED4605669.1 DsrE/DsrF/DrsH-like family protein [Paenibacillus validus]NTZ20697.1 sulfur reduction protein DsrE [Paenibacillus sp. JMULE4]
MANKKVAIIASSGGLETAYKVLNIATAAAALDAEVAIFFTFEGLSIIHKDSEQMLQLRPGNEGLAEGFKKINVPTVTQLLDVAKESGVRMIACQMTVDVMGLDQEHFIDGIELGGAAAFLDFAFDAQVTLNF